MNFDLYINDNQMTYVKNNMIDFNINEITGCYLDLQYVNLKIKKSDHEKALSLLELDKELFKNTVDKYLIEKDKYDKYGSLNSFKSIMEDVVKSIDHDDDICLTNQIFITLNEYLTSHINKELKYSTSTTASIQDFHKDMLDCLEYYSKDKWFKLKMLNQIDFILDKTLTSLVGIINQLNFETLFMPITNFLQGDITTVESKEYERIVFAFNVMRPLVVIKEPIWANLNYNKDIITKTNPKYNLLRNYVDNLNMSSFKFSNSNKIQNKSIIDVFYNNDNETFVLIL